MGALTGTLTYKQYYVEGDIPDGFRDDFLQRIQARAFRDLDPSAGEERRMGWVNVQNILDFEFDVTKFLWNQYICLGLREDAIKIPATTLKVYVQKEEAAARESRGKDRLSKFERDEIKEMVTKLLRTKTLPTIRCYDIVWNLEAKTVWFWTHNKTLCEQFEKLFEDTFALRLIPHNTYCALTYADLPERLLERVVAQEPANFVNAD